MIRAVPSNASDNVYCTLLAQSAVHGAMAGYTGYVSGLVNGRQTYIPFYVSYKTVLNRYTFHCTNFFFMSSSSCELVVMLQRITEQQNNVVITDRMWARLLSSTNQPSFLSPKDVSDDKEKPMSAQLDDVNCNGTVDVPPVTKEITK